MSEKSYADKAQWIVRICVITFSFGHLFAVASMPIQNSEEDLKTKDMQVMWEEFNRTRPTPNQKSDQKPQNQNKVKVSSSLILPKYERIESTKTKISPTESAKIGLTIWRLRPLTQVEKEEEQKGLRHKANNNSILELMPERVGMKTPLVEGDKVRLSIEVPREGYLYVIDREGYNDCSFGEPVLIFPTKRIRNGNNAVAPGRIIELPARNDNPPFFTLERSRPEHTIEELSVLVTPSPIKDLRLGESELKLSKAQFERFEKYSAIAERFELKDGVGKVWTEAEEEVGSKDNKGEGEKRLTQEDPAPQTIYRIAAKPKDPVLIKVTLKIGN